MEQLDSVTHALSKRLVPYESLIINAPNLKMILRSVKANELSGLNMEEGDAQFKLPDSFEIPGLTGNVKAKVILLPCPFISFLLIASFLSSFLLTDRGS